MKSFKWMLLLVLVPGAVHAANYDYACESDADGADALCLAEPTDLPTKKKAADIADSEESSKATPADASKPLLFGAETTQKEKAAPGLSAKVQKANNAAISAMRVQEKIRQVETFLQPIKGSDGFAGDNTGPAKAGN